MIKIKISNLGQHDLLVTKPNTLEKFLIKPGCHVELKVQPYDIEYYTFVNKLNGKLEVIEDKKPVKEVKKEQVVREATVDETTEEPVKTTPKKRRKVTL